MIDYFPRGKSLCRGCQKLIAKHTRYCEGCVDPLTVDGRGGNGYRPLTEKAVTLPAISILTAELPEVSS